MPRKRRVAIHAIIQRHKINLPVLLLVSRSLLWRRSPLYFPVSTHAALHPSPPSSIPHYASSEDTAALTSPPADSSASSACFWLKPISTNCCTLPESSWGFAYVSAKKGVSTVRRRNARKKARANGCGRAIEPTRPMPRGAHEERLVVEVLLGHHGVLRIVLLGGAKQRLQTQERCLDRESRAPLVLEDVKADGAVLAADVRVPGCGGQSVRLR